MKYHNIRIRPTADGGVWTLTGSVSSQTLGNIIGSGRCEMVPHPVFSGQMVLVPKESFTVSEGQDNVRVALHKDLSFVELVPNDN